MAHSQERARNAQDMAREAQDKVALLEQEFQLVSSETRRVEALGHAQPAGAVSTGMHAAETQPSKPDRRVAEALLQFDRDANGTLDLPEFSEAFKAGLTQVQQEVLLPPDPVRIQTSASVRRVLTAMPPAPATAVQPTSTSSSSSAQKGEGGEEGGGRKGGGGRDGRMLDLRKLKQHRRSPPLLKFP